MQNHQGHEAVIPRPRGNLPKLCAGVIAAITTGGVVFASPETFLASAALAVAMVTLGSLLHALCLLVEEVLHHRNTRSALWPSLDPQPLSARRFTAPSLLRYRGRVRLIPSACGLGGRALLAVGVGGLLLHLGAQCWELLLLAPVFYTLLKALGVLVRFCCDSQTSVLLWLRDDCCRKSSHLVTFCAGFGGSVSQLLRERQQKKQKAGWLHARSLPETLVADEEFPDLKKTNTFISKSQPEVWNSEQECIFKKGFIKWKIESKKKKD